MFVAGASRWRCVYFVTIGHNKWILIDWKLRHLINNYQDTVNKTALATQFLSGLYEEGGLIMATVGLGIAWLSTLSTVHCGVILAW